MNSPDEDVTVLTAAPPRSCAAGMIGRQAETGVFGCPAMTLLANIYTLGCQHSASRYDVPSKDTAGRMCLGGVAATDVTTRGLTRLDCVPLPVNWGCGLWRLSSYARTQRIPSSIHAELSATAA